MQTNENAEQKAENKVKKEVELRVRLKTVLGWFIRSSEVSRITPAF